MVPHLTTSLTGSLKELERLVLDQRPEIERWFRNQWLEHAAPFYTSVDLRNSGFKLAPVDTNLFPGGFNNLNPEFLICVSDRTHRAIHYGDESKLPKRWTERQPGDTAPWKE